MVSIFKTNAKKTDIELVGKNEVRIKSTGLLNAFVHSSPHALEKLHKDIGSPVSIESVTVDESGRIVIRDAAFRKAIEGKLSKATAATNTICNNGYCPPKNSILASKSISKRGGR